MTKEELLRNYGCLVLEWERDGGRDNYICRYYVNIPLSRLDIRAEDEEGNRGIKKSIDLEIGKTKVSTGGNVPSGTPFRDGAHIKWDSKRLNNLPMFVIELDGTVNQIERSLDADGSEL